MISKDLENEKQYRMMCITTVRLNLNRLMTYFTVSNFIKSVCYCLQTIQRAFSNNQRLRNNANLLTKNESTQQTVNLKRQLCYFILINRNFDINMIENTTVSYLPNFN